MKKYRSFSIPLSWMGKKHAYRKEYFELIGIFGLKELDKQKEKHKKEGFYVRSVRHKGSILKWGLYVWHPVPKFIRDKR